MAAAERPEPKLSASERARALDAVLATPEGQRLIATLADVLIVAWERENGRASGYEVRS